MDVYKLHQRLGSRVCGDLGSWESYESLRETIGELGTRINEISGEGMVNELVHIAGITLKKLAEIKGTYPHEEYTKLNLLYRIKNKDYGDSFGMSVKKFGMMAGVVRIYDKASRACQIVGNKALVEDETLEDTLGDLVNYCVMLAIEVLKDERDLLEKVISVEDKS